MRLRGIKNFLGQKEIVNYFFVKLGAGTRIFFITTEMKKKEKFLN